MIAEVCAVFGWTDAYVLSMPARRFYVMARHAKFIRYRKLVDQVDIARVSLSDMKYADRLQALYVREAMGGRRIDDEPIAVDPKIATGMNPKAQTPDDKERVRAALSLACMVKKGHKPGGRRPNHI